MPLIVGIICAALCLIVRLFSESPYEVIHRIDSNGILPPLWLLNLLSVTACFLSGFAAGLVTDEVLCGRAGGRREIAAYRGGLFFLATFFLMLAWYPIFFSAELLFIALLITVAAFLLSLCALLQWTEVRTLSVCLMVINTVWCFYLFIINLIVLLCN